MIRFLLLGLALALALFASQLLTGAEVLSAFVLRDAFLVAVVAALLFAYAAPAPPINGVKIVQAHRGLFLVALVITLAAFLRLWRLTELPPGCLEAECQQALALSEAPTARTLFDLLAQALLRLTGQSLLSLRLAGALIGALTVAAFYLAARRWAEPVGALLGVMLLALSPWHLWASRSSDPWISLPLLLCLLLWALAGLAEAQPAARSRVALWLGVLVAALLLLVNELRLLEWSLGAGEGFALVAALFHDADPAVDVLFAGIPLLGGGGAALAVLGLGYAIRYGWQRRYALLLGVTALLIVVVWQADAAQTPGGSRLLIVLPVAFVLATVALDGLFRSLQQNWQILIRPAALAGAALVLVLVLNLRPMLDFQNRLASLGSAGLLPSEAAIARQLAEGLAQTEDVTFFVPAVVIASPATRLLAGARLAEGRALPLEASLTTLAAGSAGREWRWLIPAEIPQWLDILRRLFPGGVTESQLDEQSDEVRFTTFTVAPQEWAARQGLLGVLTDAQGPQLLAPRVALAFAWDEVSAAAPFTAEWQGALLVPVTGQYGWRVAGAEGSVFSLYLDGQLLLHTEADLTEQQRFLPAGLYHIELRYQTAQPPSQPLTIFWRRPGGDWEIVPRQALLNSPLPVSGLITSVYANDRWEGEPVEQYKTFLMALPPDAPSPASVQWQAKVIAPRSGEYRFALNAAANSQLRIGGQLLLDLQPTEEAETVQAEGVIYLEQGWHDLELRTLPTGPQTPLALNWQPAGSAPEPLGPTYLAPLPPGADSSRLAPPPRPPLIAPQLGDDEFALNLAQEPWQPQTRLPPSGLPLLPFVLRWQAGEGCGADERLLDQPHGVAIDLAHNRILVADTANRRVVSFDLNGIMTTTLQDERLQEPFDLQLGPEGALLLLDALAQQIFVLDSTLTTLEPLPQEAAFYRPRGLGIDGLGNLLVADTGGGRVVRWPATGGPSDQLGGPETLFGRGQPVDVLAFGPAVWAITAEDGRLWRLDLAASMIAVQPTNTLNGPHLAGLPDGSFFLTDPARSLVLYHRASGQPMGQIHNPAALVTPTGVDVVLLNQMVYLAVVDSTNCTLSWWQAPAPALPR